MPATDLSARITALELFGDVVNKRRSLDEALDGVSSRAAMEPRDLAFARHLVATTLRRLGQIDALIDHGLERPLPRKARPVRDLLRLGLCQLLFMRTADHAAIDTAVRMAQQTGLGPYKKLVNAILRRLQREGGELLKAQDAARINTPDWLWQSWAAAYGENTAHKIAAAHLIEAPLDISTLSDATGWAEKLDARLLPTGSLRRDSGGAVPDLPGFDEGKWWVQDAAAWLVSGLLGDVAGKQVIDLCAAPGGKTAALAGRGAQVIAVDRSENRLTRLEENLSRLNVKAEVVCADAVQWRPAEPAHAVLVDAPCSATGTIRRHPDIPRLKSEADVDKLVVLQEKLLAAAVDMVRPGGVIVYCTCSLQPEEGPAQVAKFLAERPVVKLDRIAASEVADLSELITPDGVFRSLPCHLSDLGGIDGFYAARLRKQ